jgi:hypothetical protein
MFVRSAKSAMIGWGVIARASMEFDAAAGVASVPDTVSIFAVSSTLRIFFDIA